MTGGGGNFTWEITWDRLGGEGWELLSNNNISEGVKALDRRAWNASFRDVVNAIGDAGSTRPGWIPTQVQVQVPDDAQEFRTENLWKNYTFPDAALTSSLFGIYHSGCLSWLLFVLQETFSAVQSGHKGDFTDKLASAQSWKYSSNDHNPRPLKFRSNSATNIHSSICYSMPYYTLTPFCNNLGRL